MGPQVTPPLKELSRALPLPPEVNCIRLASRFLANDCGNGELPLNVGCQNIDSQVQGDENSVALPADQVFPSIGDDNRDSGMPVQHLVCKVPHPLIKEGTLSSFYWSLC